MENFVQKHEKLSDLLRTPEEEDIIAKERGTNYVYKARQGKHAITIYGTEHFFVDLKKAAILRMQLETQNPDLVLVEGTAWKKLFESEDLSVIKEEDVLAYYGEEYYVALMAKKKNIQTATWDVAPKQQLEAALKIHPIEAVFGWGIGQGAKHILDQKKPLTKERLKKMLSAVFTVDVIEYFKKQGFDFDPDSINFDAIAKKYTGVPVSKMTYALAEQIATPRHRGPTNDVIRDMNKVRDEHAIKTIQQAKKKYKNILVMCGGSHAITWEPAVKSLYSDKEKSVV